MTSQHGSEKSPQLSDADRILDKISEGSMTDLAFEPEKIDLELGNPESRSSRAEGIGRPLAVLLREKEASSNESFASSISTLSVVKVDLEEQALPIKGQSRVFRNLRYTIFSVYHRLSALIIILNIILIAALLATTRAVVPDTQTSSTAAAANILAAVLIRQEWIINLLFTIFSKCPLWMPLRIRRLSAKIYHLGGVHSGTGIAGILWFGVLNIPIVEGWRRDTLQGAPADNALFITTILLDLLLISMVVLSHPRLRARHHNAWEVAHRFAGWAAVALFWVHIVLSTKAQQQISLDIPVLQLLAISPVFWCIVVMTIALVLPWVRLRKVSVRAEYLSDRATLLHLHHRNLPLCATPRFSDNPLKEWHAFAGIPARNGAGLSVLVSNAGDWTAKLINSPPESLWIKDITVRGILHIVPIFKKTVLVATGSGIGAVLSLVHVRNLDARIIWSTADPLRYYSSKILDQVRSIDPEAMVFDTTKGSRPDLVREAYRLYKTSDAEAVFIVSNAKVTRKFVYSLESRGVPVFGPIFDS